MDMANSESDSTSDFVDIHVGGSLQFHTIFIHTVSGIDGLGMRMITIFYVSMSIHKSGNHTTI